MSLFRKIREFNDSVELMALEIYQSDLDEVVEKYRRHPVFDYNKERARRYFEEQYSFEEYFRDAKPSLRKNVALTKFEDKMDQVSNKLRIKALALEEKQVKKKVADD